MEDHVPDKLTEQETELLEGILERNHSYAQQLDTYANIMIALSSAIFIFSFSQLHNERSLFWLTLGFTTGIATILALTILRPPRSLRKQGQQESVMYSREITSHSSSAAYGQKLRRALSSREAALDEYAKEIYNLTKYYYLPKKLLFRTAKTVLLCGIVISLLIFVSEYFS